MNALVATDGSKYGQWALNWVAKLPFVKSPQVTVLHVIDSAWVRGPFRTRSEVQRTEAHSASTLKKATQQLALLKLRGTARQEKGAVAPTILKRAPKRDGLLVVGSQGLDAFERFMLGSVSTKLIQYAPCSVLVVKGVAVPVRRMILATDGSSGSAHALAFVLSKFQPDYATDKGRRVPIHVSVVYVRMPSPLAPITIKSPIPWIRYPGLKDVGLKLVEQTVQKLVEAGFTAEPVRPLGRPADEILKMASKDHADLIVMGANGLGAMDRFVLGSVSTRVVQHAKGSVLVVR